MRNATAASNFVAWAAAEAERSSRFRAEVVRLRQLAAGSHRAGYARTTGPLTEIDWSGLNLVLAGSRTQSQEERPRAWKRTDLATDDGLRHVHQYLRGCRKVARQFLGSENVAPLVHELVAGTGYYVGPVRAIAPIQPTGARASVLAAHVSGASWGSGATALRVAWRRARPGEDENAVFVL